MALAFNVVKYRPEIDGLRAVAVLPVIFFHAGFSVFQGGFIGVDVFFVISGYLITSIIINEIDEGRFSLVSFYERRVRRILPALFLVVLCCLPLAFFFLLPEYLKNFSQSVVAVSVFSSNILFWKESGYFDTALELKPLLHTWSLAVEEQYYVLFPLLLIMLWPRSKVVSVLLLAVLFFASLFYSQWSAFYAPDAAFFLLPSRFWEFLVGSFVAIYLAYGKRDIITRDWVVNVLSIIGLLLIALPVFFFHEDVPFPGFAALLPTIGTALIIVFAKPSTWVFKALSQPVCVGVGLISYSLYLWHQPLFSFAHFYFVEGLPPALPFMLILVSFALSYLSWKYVELPFRDRQAVSRWHLAFLIVPMWGLFLVLGLFGHKTGGFIDRSPPQNMSRDAYYIMQDYGISSVGLDGKLCETEKSSICLRHKADGEKAIFGKMLLLGDSHSADFEKPFTGFARLKNADAWQMSAGGCSFIPYHYDRHNGECKKAVEDALSFVRDQRVDTVMLVVSMAGHFRPLSSEVVDEQVRAFYDFVEQLGNRGAKVVFFTPRETLDLDPNLARFAQKECLVQPLEIPELYLEFEHELSERLKSFGGRAFDQRQYLSALQGGKACGKGYLGDKPLYSDTNHLTEFGAERVFEAFVAVSGWGY